MALMEIDIVGHAVLLRQTAITIEIPARLPAIALKLVAGPICPFKTAALWCFDCAGGIMVLRKLRVKARNIHHVVASRRMIVVEILPVDQVEVTAVVVHPQATGHIGVQALDLEVIRLPAFFDIVLVDRIAVDAHCTHRRALK
ncbi:hypothetical protein [Rhodophyticola porphyridii]|uniref:hypothetical protein n=1 Tax=Rhodophyticola porphyridii TaxID=1852017 RepID=UPI0035D07A72